MPDTPDDSGAETSTLRHRNEKTKQNKSKKSPVPGETTALEEQAAGLVEMNLRLRNEILRCKMFEGRLKLAHRKLLDINRRRLFLSKKLVDLLEEERKDISRELHDDIGQMLTTINMELEALKNGISGASHLRKALTSLQTRIGHSIEQVRNVCRGLRPDILDHLGLVPAIRNLAASVGKSAGINIRVFAGDIPDLGKATELPLYRIVQEALNNVVRHARAGNVFINVSRREKSLLLTVEDDGVGFDVRALESADVRTRNLGILIMKERALQAGGRLQVESEEKKGTRVMISMPIRRSALVLNQCAATVEENPHARQDKSAYRG